MAVEALVAGWAVGIASGISMFAVAHNNSTFTWMIAGHPVGIHSALSSVILSVVVTAVLTPVFKAVPFRPRRGAAKAEA